MNSPEISVVIPTYRALDLLRNAIESVLQQTFDDFEIVLVDNNASVDTKKVAEEFRHLHPKKVRIVYESTPGVCSARNRGILESRGSYVALLDEDDLMLPDRLKHQYAVMKNHPELSLVTCHCNVLSYDGESILKKNVPVTGEWSEYCADLVQLIKSPLDQDQPSSFYLTMPSTFFFKKETAIHAGLFDTRMNPQYCEDDEFQIRMFEQGKFHMIPNPLIYFRNALRKPKYSVSFRLAQSFRLLGIIYEKYGSDDRKRIRILRKIYSKLLINYGLELYKYKSGARFGNLFLKKAFYYSPSMKKGKLFLKTYFPDKYYKRLFWVETDALPSEDDLEYKVLNAVLSWNP